MDMLDGLLCYLLNSSLYKYIKIGIFIVSRFKSVTTLFPKIP